MLDLIPLETTLLCWALLNALSCIFVILYNKTKTHAPRFLHIILLTASYLVRASLLSGFLLLGYASAPLLFSAFRYALGYAYYALYYLLIAKHSMMLASTLKKRGEKHSHPAFYFSNTSR